MQKTATMATRRLYYLPAVAGGIRAKVGALFVLYLCCCCCCHGGMAWTQTTDVAVSTAKNHLIAETTENMSLVGTTSIMPTDRVGDGIGNESKPQTTASPVPTTTATDNNGSCCGNTVSIERVKVVSSITTTIKDDGSIENISTEPLSTTINTDVFSTRLSTSPVTSFSDAKSSNTPTSVTWNTTVSSTESDNSSNSINNSIREVDVTYSQSNFTLINATSTMSVNSPGGEHVASASVTLAMNLQNNNTLATLTVKSPDWVNSTLSSVATLGNTVNDVGDVSAANQTTNYAAASNAADQTATTGTLFSSFFFQFDNITTPSSFSTHSSTFIKTTNIATSTSSPTAATSTTATIVSMSSFFSSSSNSSSSSYMPSSLSSVATTVTSAPTSTTTTTPIFNSITASTAIPTVASTLGNFSLTFFSHLESIIFSSTTTPSSSSSPSSTPSSSASSTSSSSSSFTPSSSSSSTASWSSSSNYSSSSSSVTTRIGTETTTSPPAPIISTSTTAVRSSSYSLTSFPLPSSSFFYSLLNNISSATESSAKLSASSENKTEATIRGEGEFRSAPLSGGLVALAIIGSLLAAILTAVLIYSVVAKLKRSRNNYSMDGQWFSNRTFERLE